MAVPEYRPTRDQARGVTEMPLGLDENGQISVESLPAVPGGWSTRNVDLGVRSVHLTLPANPDGFVDDKDVLAAGERDDYMPFWANLWPASLPMARQVASQSWSAGLRTLEVGCGIGLVGIAALSRGLDVTFSDYDPLAVEIARGNARQNGFVTEAPADMRFDWRDLKAVTLQPFPVILGCDVLYELDTHGPVLDVIDRFMNVDGICWLGDPGRQYLPAFCTAAKGRGYLVELRDDSGATVDSLPVGAFRLLVISRKRAAQ